MRKIFVVLMFVFIAWSAGAQALNQRNVNNFMSLVEKFVADQKSYYHLQIIIYTGEGGFREGNIITTEQSDKRIIADVAYHKKLSFIWFHIYLEKTDTKRAYDDSPRFETWEEKDYFQITFDKAFEPYEGFGIKAFLSGIFKSIGFN